MEIRLSKNPRSREYIQQCYPDARLSLLDVCGIGAASKEATSFAFMGLECILGRPMIVPSMETQDPTICGKITPGLNYGELIGKIAAFHKLRSKGVKHGVSNGVDETNGVSTKRTYAMRGSWLPAVRDLRVKNNQTREKEQRDPLFMNSV